MKALEFLKQERAHHLAVHNDKSIINQYDEAIKELEFYLNKRNSYPPCDTCGKEVDYMPWHYSTEKERHLHSCDECWVSIKDKETIELKKENKDLKERSR